MKREFSACIGVDERGHLRIEERDAVDLAEEFGTPLFVISEGQIRHNVRAITRAFRDRYPRTEIRDRAGGSADRSGREHPLRGQARRPGAPATAV